MPLTFGEGVWVVSLRVEVDPRVVCEERLHLVQHRPHGPHAVPVRELEALDLGDLPQDEPFEAGADHLHLKEGRDTRTDRSIKA